MLETIQEALRRGDLAAAAAAARDLIAREPGHADAHHLLGLALRGLGDMRAASEALDRALELVPERPVFHISRAMLAAQQGDVERAHAGYTVALKLDPNQLAAYIALAELALGAGAVDQAEQHLRFAERIAPEHPHVDVLRAQLELGRGAADVAVSRLTRAARRVPNDAMVQGTLGLAFLQQGHHGFAEQALRNALAQQPHAAAVRRGLVRALLAQKQYDAAAQEVATLLEQRPDDAAALTLQGQLALARGDTDAAVAALTRALEHAPLPVALESLLSTLLQRGDARAARDAVERLLARTPQLDFAWSALLQLLRGDRAAAFDAATRWRAALPESASAAEAAAQAAEDAGEFDVATAHAQQALARHPDRIGAALVLARAHLRREDAAAAIALLAPIYVRNDVPEVRMALAPWLGRACDVAGEVAEAVRYWRECHALALPGATAPALSLPDDALADRLDALAANTRDAAPAWFLFGAPGSEIERVAARLSSVPGRRLLGDRFGPQARDDAFQSLVFEPVPDADALLAPWHAALAARGVEPAHAIDWLPNFDARWLPALRAGLPRSKRILVLRDPRDMLLSWLAQGSAQGILASDPVRAAAWLALALEQIVFAQTHDAARTFVLRLDIAEARDDAEFARFLDLEELPAPVPVPTRAGLVAGFPGGHWRRYREVLNEAFARLDAVATRLGY